MKKKNLTYLELSIMQVLWTSGTPLTASEIVKQKTELKLPTVQRLLKTLLAEKYIEVADIVSSGKVLARRYRPTFNSEDYLQHEFNTYIPLIHNKVSFSKGIVAALLNNTEEDESVIEELERFIDQRKSELEKRYED